MACCLTTASHYWNQCWFCPGGRWVNSLGPSHTIWRHRSASTLAQVMACCLTAPSHYLNQCWLIINKVKLHSSASNFTRDNSAINHWNQFENHLSKISFKSPRGQWVKNVPSSCMQSPPWTAVGSGKTIQTHNLSDPSELSWWWNALKAPYPLLFHWFSHFSV